MTLRLRIPTERELKMLKSNSKELAIISLTKIGSDLARKLHAHLADSDLYLPARFAENSEMKFSSGKFKSTCQELFSNYKGLVCIMATGIVVRTISPLIKDKLVDPAVVVIDELGNHVISLLSGHVGQANRLTKVIAKILKSDPVITTATDTEKVQALDTLSAIFNGWYPDFKYYTKLINARLAAGDPVDIYIDQNFENDLVDLSGFTRQINMKNRDPNIPLVIVSDKDSFGKVPNSIQIVPKLNVLGVGARKAVSYGMAQQALVDFCKANHLVWQSFCEIVSIDKKQHENAIHYLADTLNIPSSFFTTNQLLSTTFHYPQSSFVKKIVGVGNVAHAAAEFASGSRTFTKAFTSSEFTLAASRKKILLPGDEY